MPESSSLIVFPGLTILSGLQILRTHFQLDFGSVLHFDVLSVPRYARILYPYQKEKNVVECVCAEVEGSQWAMSSSSEEAGIR
ncbi:hypothetical protein CDAR_201821 [Caerostris darwini]|uniref:Uncharacterized protein n=1 Tax=Caerostris darwini TaxID=1538125 RepID=A0AAV4T167_9ARAC|nr:hypothetical protein CDAR_201821 [Caerostris darwini]